MLHILLSQERLVLYFIRLLTLLVCYDYKSPIKVIQNIHKI